VWARVPKSAIYFGYVEVALDALVLAAPPRAVLLPVAYTVDYNRDAYRGPASIIIGFRLL